jgi:hypothetical protein
VEKFAARVEKTCTDIIMELALANAEIERVAERQGTIVPLEEYS